MKGWVIPPLENSDFIAHMELVLDVFKTPYDKAFPVVCMDESPRHLIKQTRITIARKPGRDAREDYEYERKSVVNIFMANECAKSLGIAKYQFLRSRMD